MIRKATAEDVPAIKKLIDTHAGRELMLSRSLSEIYDNLRDFHLWIEDGAAVACCGLHVTWEDLAEVRSLSVSEGCQGRGIGRALVNACLEEAAALGMKRIFALTYVPEFLKKLGFEEIDKHELPHKVWGECSRCTKFPDCDEVPLMIALDSHAEPKGEQATC